MEREIITTWKAPAAIGPYSQAVKTGGFVFTAGQIALDPATGKLVEGDITAQTRRVLENIAAILEAAGSALSCVVKTTVFLRRLEDFKAFNAAYSEFFPVNPPARLTIGAGDIPLGALVEIDATAVVLD